jgi:hypothetical protein
LGSSRFLAGFFLAGSARGPGKERREGKSRLKSVVRYPRGLHIAMWSYRLDSCTEHAPEGSAGDYFRSALPPERRDLEQRLMEDYEQRMCAVRGE